MMVDKEVEAANDFVFMKDELVEAVKKLKVQSKEILTACGVDCCFLA